MALTRQQIVAAAIARLESDGLDALSLRKVAADVGVSAPTLYWHVRDKRELLDLMAEDLLRRNGAAPAPPRDGQPWWQWLEEHTRHLFDVLVSTRDAPRVLAGNRPTVQSWPQVERTLAVLVDAGLTPLQAQQSLFALGAYVIGSATEWQAEADRERLRQQSGPSTQPADAEMERAESLEHHPVLRAVMEAMATQPHRATFEHGLVVMIAGLRALAES